MSIAQNASPETRAFLASVLSIDAVLPSESERERITRDLLTRMVRQRDGRKAAAIARERRKQGNPLGGIGIGRRTGKPGRPQQEIALSPEQRRQIREIYGADNLVTMREIGERVGANPETVIRWLEREGLRKRPPRDRGAFGRELALKMVPEGCIESTDLRERLGVHKSTMLKRLAAVGIKPAGRASNVWWYAEADLRAKGMLP